jgi:hypothetical protein
VCPGQVTDQLSPGASVSASHEPRMYVGSHRSGAAAGADGWDTRQRSPGTEDTAGRLSLQPGKVTQIPASPEAK